MKLLDQTLLIEWAKFKPGTSFFVPCWDRRGMVLHISAEARRLRVDIVAKSVIERGMYGVRVWRVDATLDPALSPLPR